MSEAEQETELRAAAKAALPALELLGDYIGNTFAGKVGFAPFDRCRIILDLKHALALDVTELHRLVGLVLARADAAEALEFVLEQPVGGPSCGCGGDHWACGYESLDDEEEGACILTGAEGENADDCTTHEHEPQSATPVEDWFTERQASRRVAGFDRDSVKRGDQVQWDSGTGVVEYTTAEAVHVKMAGDRHYPIAWSRVVLHVPA